MMNFKFAALMLTVMLAGCSRSVMVNDVTTQIAEPTPQPEQRNIPDFAPIETEQAAIDIALRAWIPVYGKEQIDGEKPYIATLENGVWYVHGSLPANSDGGYAEAWISKDDGRVIKYIHGK